MKLSRFFCFYMFFFIIMTLCGCKRNASPITPEPSVSFIAGGSYHGQYWPTTQWKSCAPADVGMNADKLMEAYNYAANPAVNTEGLVIIKNGYIIAEAYFNDFSRSAGHWSYSVAKSFTGALVGIAIAEGYIDGVNQKVSHFFPLWQTQDTPAAKKEMEIRHLLTMTSRLQWVEEDFPEDNPNDDIPLIMQENDYLQYVLNKSIDYDPGSHFYYSSGDTILLSGIIGAAAGKTAYAFALEHLFNHTGLSEVTWESDDAGLTVGAWGIRASLREFAKFGYLYLNYGLWEDRQVVPRAWVEDSLQPVA
ncbi:MAG: serine hydrolase, partial [bacterium]|nr:serine hydrolase [bacterium]